MDSKKIVFQQTALVAVGEVLCTGIMLGIYALIGFWSTAVLVGGIVGAVLAIGNFFFMAIGAMLAADKAQQQDVKGGQAMLHTSMLLRYVLMIGVLVLFAWRKLGDPVAMVIPIFLLRPVMMVGQFFGKSGDRLQ